MTQYTVSCKWGGMGGVVVEHSPLTTVTRVRFLDSVSYGAEFVPCFEGFSPGSLVFLPPQKSTFLNSNSIIDKGHKFIIIIIIKLIYCNAYFQ
jgi:hypothetical protein